jgi:hypothetical protein
MKSAQGGFKVNVQLLYIDGCPHWKMMEDRLHCALEVLGIETTIERCLVENQEDADRFSFPGSPSVLLDGRDPFPMNSDSFGVTCRRYLTPAGPSGTPTVGQLTEVIRRAEPA